MELNYKEDTSHYKYSFKLNNDASVNFATIILGNHIKETNLPNHYYEAFDQIPKKNILAENESNLVYIDFKENKNTLIVKAYYAHKCQHMKDFEKEFLMACANRYCASNNKGFKKIKFEVEVFEEENNEIISK